MKPIYHKFKNVPTKEGDWTYSSRKEAAYAAKLKLLKASGVVLFYLEQVPIRLPGKVKYVVDFVEFHADGTVRFVDCKGVRTPMYILKKKQVEEIYPFEIEEN